MDRRLQTAFAAIVGERNVLTAAADTAPYTQDWRRQYSASAEAVLRPASTAEVAALVGLCAREGVAVVPQGGNTGLCGGSVPTGTRREVVLSLGRLNRIRAVDALNDTLTAEAGCVLAEVQRAAEQADRLFALSLAAEGSCQIGGTLSTNAGGVNVLRYGNAREQVLGLEVVLPDGRIWDGLRGLRKDNTGYDLKQLFIGAEGTLGVVTAATLRLFPRPAQTATALAHFFAGRPDEALLWAVRAVREQPKFLISTCVVAASAGLTARPSEAEKAMARLRQLNPALRLSNLKALFPLRRSEDVARWSDALRRAGLPE